MTAPLSAALHQIISDINYWTNLQLVYSKRYESAEAKYSKYVKEEEAWCEVYDSVMDTDEGETKKINGVKYRGGVESDAILAADRKVGEIDYEAIEEAHDISVNYDEIKALAECQLELLNAQKQSVQTQLQQRAADTGMTNGG